MPSPRIAEVRPAITSDGSRRAASAAFILPTPSAMEMKRSPLAPNGAGSSVSSMDRQDTPACSHSSTVRITFSALP